MCSLLYSCSHIRLIRKFNILARLYEKKKNLIINLPAAWSAQRQTVSPSNIRSLAMVDVCVELLEILTSMTRNCS